MIRTIENAFVDNLAVLFGDKHVGQVLNKRSNWKKVSFHMTNNDSPHAAPPSLIRTGWRFDPHVTVNASINAPASQSDASRDGWMDEWIDSPQVKYTPWSVAAVVLLQDLNWVKLARRQSFEPKKLMTSSNTRIKDKECDKLRKEWVVVILY